LLHSPNFRKTSLKNDTVFKVFVAYDIESAQIIDKTNKDQLRHIPNLLVSKTVCDNCWSIETLDKKDQNCDFCGIGEIVFKGKACILDFCNYLYGSLAKTVEKKRKNICFCS
jgi:hypothetical protein